MPLDPKAKSLLDMIYRVGAPRLHELDEAQARRSFEKLLFAFRPEAPPVASVSEVPMARADGSVLITRLYRPLQSAADAVLPLLVYCHGGGWCLGSVGTYDVLCRELANAANIAVLSVGYRLAPEHPFPAALEDAGRAVEWAMRHANMLHIDPLRVAMGGDSAGGNLTLATALARRERGDTPALRELALIYPCTEIHSERASRKAYADGYGLDRQTLLWFFARYLPQGGADDWRASPMAARSLAGLPPMTLVTAECDPLTDDCRAFAERVQAEGGAVTHYTYPGMIHGFFTLGRHFPQGNEAVARVAASLADALHTP